MKAPSPRAILGISRCKGRETAAIVAARYGTRAEIVVRVWACMRAPNAPAPAVPCRFDAAVQAALLGARVLARDYNETPKPVTVDLQVGRSKVQRRQRVMGRNGDIVYPKRPGQRVRGRPVHLRIPEEHLAIIDRIVAEHKAASRAEAIRHMVEQALEGGREAVG